MNPVPAPFVLSLSKDITHCHPVLRQTQHEQEV